MLTIAAFILPALAIGTVLFVLSKPLRLAFGSHELKQEYENNPQLVSEMAHQREQGDEYETLIEMDFVPLGVYHESLDAIPGTLAELVFEHRSLPVFAVLCQNIDQQRFVLMMTEGQGKKLLKSSSTDATPEVRESDLRMVKVEADYIEDVLATHIREMNAWEEEGFVAANSSGLAEFSRICREHVAHPFVAKLLRSNGLKMAWASLVALSFVPWVVGLMMAWGCSTLFDFNLMKLPTLLQFVSGWVLVFGGYLYWNITRIVPNEESNSLKKSTALCAAQTVDVDSFRIQSGKGYDLPFRDTTIIRQQALEWLMGGSVAVMGVLAMAIAVVLNPSLRNSPIVFWAVLAPIGACVSAGPILIFAWQVLRNRTKHELQIDSDSIIAREKRSIYDYKRECKIKDVASIRVEHLRNCPKVMHYLSSVCDDEYAAPAYRVDVLVSLASKIAAEIGLEADKVVLAKEFMNESDVEEQEPEEKESIKDFLTEGVLN